MAVDAIQIEADKNHDNNLSSEKLEMLRKGEIVKRFFDNSPNQITYEGLFRIHATMKEGELAILFRNNHFSTIILHDGALYSLVTDVGYQHRDDYIWERVENLTGDTTYHDCKFREVNIRSPRIGNGGGHTVTPDFGLSNYLDDSEAIARRQQAEEDAELARRIARQDRDQKPIGKLRKIGYDEYDRELYVDETGQKFHSVKRKDRDKDSSDDDKDSKCLLM